MQKHTTVSKYINELEAYKLRYQQLEVKNHELEKNISDYHNKYIVYQNKSIEYENKYYELKEKYDLLIYKRFGRSAEQILKDEKQLLLLIDETKESTEREKAKPQEVIKVKQFQRKKGGRKPISPSLSRRERIIDIAENEKTCECGAKRVKIGELTSEKLEIIPPEIYVDKIVRPKYACKCCEGTETEGSPTVRVAPVEPSILPRGIVSPSVASTVITQKFHLHLPYYRQEKQFEDIGVAISRQDMSNWQQHIYKKLDVLFILLKKTLLSWIFLQMDETILQVIGEEGRSDLQKSYMWVARGGPPDKKVILYEYHSSRSGLHAKEFLEGYRGHLQTDGFSGYDSAVKENSNIIQIGCWAHSRRKFFEASKAGKEPKSAEIGLSFIRKLYEIENKLRSQWDKDSNTEKFLLDRKKACESELAKFHSWLVKRKDEVPESTLLGKAISYALSQWSKLIAYLENPYSTPDNNACENAIRPFVIGRKNWLFSQCPDGAKSSAGMFTLVETAKANGHTPYKYLKYIFEKAPYASSIEDWEKLLPWNVPKY